MDGRLEGIRAGEQGAGVMLVGWQGCGLRAAKDTFGVYREWGGRQGLQSSESRRRLLSGPF